MIPKTQVTRNLGICLHENFNKLYKQVCVCCIYFLGVINVSSCLDCTRVRISSKNSKNVSKKM